MPWAVYVEIPDKKQWFLRRVFSIRGMGLYTNCTNKPQLAETTLFSKFSTVCEISTDFDMKFQGEIVQQIVHRWSLNAHVARRSARDDLACSTWMYSRAKKHLGP